MIEKKSYINKREEEIIVEKARLYCNLQEEYLREQEIVGTLREQRRNAEYAIDIITDGRQYSELYADEINNIEKFKQKILDLNVTEDTLNKELKELKDHMEDIMGSISVKRKLQEYFKPEGYHIIELNSSVVSADEADDTLIRYKWVTKCSEQGVYWRGIGTKEGEIMTRIPNTNYFMVMRYIRT